MTQRTLDRPALLAVAFILAFGPRCMAADPPAEYLADAASERIVSVTTGWGELGLNTGVKPAGRPARPMTIKDREYQRGLGHHAPGEIVVDLGGRYKTFECEIGIQWQGGQAVASAVFQVVVDEQKRFDSGVVREQDAPRKVSIPIAGAEELRLVVTDAGDGITCDCANWAEARLVPDPTPRPVAAVRPALDIAPFARVVTSDPKRTEGTRAGRTEEFPAEDVFLTTEILPAADGSYTVPAHAAVGCIGLEWPEMRLLREVGLELAEPQAVPPADKIQLQSWTGESPWQGSWKSIAATPQRSGARLAWRIGYKDISRGTPKVRWLFSSKGKPVVLRSLSALTRSSWKTVGVRLQSERPACGERGQIEVYNGALVDPPAGSSPHRCAWDTASPLALKVTYSVPKPYKADRTVLRLHVGGAAFGVAVEDLLSHDCVYVPHAGVFVTRDPPPVSLEAYRQRIAGQKTVLAQVRTRPDQTFVEAMAKVHNPVQDLGPMMLSLACDNRKFVVHREGAIVFDLYERPDDPPRDIPKQLQLVPHFGAGQTKQLTRRLDGGWLPMPVTTVSDSGVVYRQRTYVAPLDGGAAPQDPAWLRDRAVCVAEFTAENPGDKPADATLALVLQSGDQRVAWQAAQTRLTAARGDRLLAVIDARQAGPLGLKTEGPVARWAGTLAPGAKPRLVACVPAWKAAIGDAAATRQTADLAERTAAYWTHVLGPAMQADLPDPLLTNVIRASQVHCLLAARNEDRGRLVSPWISSDRYGPLESEANSILRGMGLWGHDDFTRRGLDFLLKRYNEAGFLTTGYTVVGTGWNLWTLAEHFERTQDRAWLEAAAPTVARACRWIVRQRAKTRKLDARGQKIPGYGLMPPGVAADWNRYAYRFFNDAHYCAGLAQAAAALARINHPDAAALLKDAREYREDILRAYRWTQARMPVVPLAAGAWVPNHPAIVDYFGNVEDFTPGEDGNRSWAGSVEIGSHYLVPSGVLDPASPDVTWMADYLEDHQFLRSGMGDYPEERSRQDPLGLGGFAKLQPYYCRIAELYALQDDVQPFVRSYFNAIPSLLSLENLSFWEHFHNMGGWNKTHETGSFLTQSRWMLVMERGEELWLAPFVTNQWLQDGMKLSVRNAPTRFGKVSYAIRSSAASGFIEAEVDPPTCTPPAQIVLRLRHPEGKPMRRIIVNGRPHDRFDPKRECVLLAPGPEKITIRADY